MADLYDNQEICNPKNTVATTIRTKSIDLQIPICCPSGWATIGPCQVEGCAKAEGETCGGMWGTSGRCAV